MVKPIIFCVLCVLVLAQGAHATDNRIIVQPVTNSSGEHELDPLSRGFSDLLVAYLSGYEELEILYRDDMHRLWQELARAGSGIERSDAMRIGALVQANTLIKGGFVKINGHFRANVHVYDIATTQLQFSLNETGDIETVDRLAATLARKIADRLLNAGVAGSSLPTDAAPLVNSHFMKGLGYHYNALYDHAVAEFMQVIDLDPARADARLWLGRSYGAAGDIDHARIEYRRFLTEYPDHEDSHSVRQALGSL